MQEIIGELSGPRALRALSTITGIDSLLPDPFLEGGGLHYTEPGGKLLPHTDFHDHPRLQLYRRVNALLYLNPDWQPGDGGEVALFNLGSDEPAVIVPPDVRDLRHLCHRPPLGPRRHAAVRVRAASASRSRCTTTRSNRPRSSAATGGPTGTTPTSRGSTGATAKVRLGAMKAALGASKLLTEAAYRVDPQRPDLV